MLKKDKNRMLQVIKDCGFDPADFEPAERTLEAKTLFVLKHVHSPLSFAVHTSPDSYEQFEWAFKRMVPGFTDSPWLPHDHFGNLPGLLIALDDWLLNHVQLYLEEQSTPDLWDEVKSQIGFGPQSESQGNSQYSQEEQRQIKMGIKHIGILIQAKCQLSEAQEKIVSERLNYLSEAVERLGRFDWRAVLLSTMIGIATNLSLDTERGHQLYDIFRAALSGLLHLPK